MATIFKIKNSVTTTAAPTTLVQGEAAVNITDKKLWVGNAASSPVQLLGAGATVNGTDVNYTGTLTGGTGVVNLGSGQFYKDASGRVAIGGTPVTWSGTLLQVSSKSIFGTVGSNDTQVVTNGNWTGTQWSYISTAAASNYYQDITSAPHVWRYAGSGTAGNAITWSEAMRIDTSGNCGIGTASPSARLDVRTAAGTASQINIITGSSAAASTLQIGQSGSVFWDASVAASTGNFQLGINGGGLGYNINRSGTAIDYHSWLTAGTERMRIDSSGNVGIGTSSPAAKLNISGTGGVYFRIDSTTNSGVLNYVGANLISALTDAQTVFAGGLTTDGAVSAKNNLLFGTASAERMRIDSSGNLLINKTSSSNANWKVQINCTANTSTALSIEATTTAATEAVYFRNPSGTVGIISTSGTSTTYATSSDYRLKENVAPMQNALATVQALKPVTYNWKFDGSSGQGFIAHELQAVVPDCVTGEKDATRVEQYEITPAIPATLDEDGNELTPAVEAVMGERVVPVYQGIDTSFLVATLTSAIQEQQVMINELKAKVAALEAA